MLANLRLALRSFAKVPGFTGVIILTLALGIGANTAIFSIVNTTYLRALPYPEPERLVHVAESNRQWSDISVSYPNFVDWQAQQDVFSGLAIYRTGPCKLKTPAGSVEQVTLGRTSADFFAVLGVHALQGRDLSPNDDRAGAAPVAWLTHAAWQHYFAGSPDLVGNTVLIDGQAVAVAGILPAGFRFRRNADVYMPLAPHIDRLFMREREQRSDTNVVGRLKPGITFAAAQAQMAAIGRRLERDYPQANAGIGVSVVPLRARITGESRTNLLLLGAVGTVLLIGCVNVANMLLARSFAREREMAIRIALGATRGALARQLLTESLLLALAGGVAGAALGLWGCQLGWRLVPWETQALFGDGGTVLDVRVLLFVAGATLLTGIGFGLAPAWQLSHVNPQDALKNTTRRMRTVVGRFHLGDLLVVAQVALALMLLIGAGLMIRSLRELTNVSTGLQPEKVLTLRVAAPPMDQYMRDPMGYVTYHERVLEAVRALPEVASAAFCSSMPFSWDTSSNNFFRMDRPTPAAGAFPTANSHIITPDYFQTMGIPLVRGQLFDGHEPEPVFPQGSVVSLETVAKVYENLIISGVISRRMAEQIWPGEDPIGKVFQLGFPNMNLGRVRVVGIVGNTTQSGLDGGEPAEFYLTLRQQPAPNPLYLTVRTRLDPAAALASVRTAIQSVVRDEPVFDVKLMSARIADSVSGRRFNMGLFTFFAGTALLLSLIGIYGVLSFVVGQRTREIGLRMALGAQRAHVLGHIVWRGFALILTGSAIGLVGAWSLSRLLQSQLFGVTRTDLFTYVAGTALLLVAGLFACFVPARRATKVDPLIALRAE